MTIVPLDVPMSEIDLATHSLTGWPKEGACACGARAAMLVATYDSASYECRGTPTDPATSAYGPDGCGRTFSVARSPAGSSVDREADR